MHTDMCTSHAHIEYATRIGAMDKSYMSNRFSLTIFDFHNKRTPFKAIVHPKIKIKS